MDVEGGVDMIARGLIIFIRLIDNMRIPFRCLRMPWYSIVDNTINNSVAEGGGGEINIEGLLKR